MNNFFTKTKLYFSTHKISSLIILVVILGAIYWGYTQATSPAGETRYVTSAVTKGTIVSSITDSGQVSALNQINITPTVSGTLTSVNVKPGDNVREGETLFNIDDTTAQKAVRDAEIGVQNANLALQKLQLQSSSTDLNSALSKSYSDGFSAVTSTISDLNSTLAGINTTLSKENLSDNAARGSGDTAYNYRESAITDYGNALAAFEQNNSDFIKLSNASPTSDIDNIIEETSNTTNLLSDAIKSATTYINYMAQVSINPSSFTSDQTTLSTYTNTINTDSANLLSNQTTIKSNQDAFPTNDLDTQSAQIAIKQAQNALLDAQNNLAYYHIAAPFSGVIASVPVITGDNVSSGTTLATIITTKELAVVSLSEVDVAKISLGEKATLTFDAIPNLTIAGQVVEIDSVGTVSSGVVNYNVQISFDTTSDQGVKPGMSVNAAIITNVAQDVLEVPSGAVKTSGGVSYVQTFATALPAPTVGVQGSVSATPPKKQIVEIGVTDGTSTEIISGLKEGDDVVTKTITSATTTSTTSAAPSILGSSSGRGGGVGGGVRIP